MTVRILGLIPARAGSKGIPGKNLKLLGGRPLVAHSIEAARQADCLDRILVSTDAQEIADVARRHGAEVPWLRPADLATDTASIEDVVLHALRSLAEEGYRPEAVMVLQPTSPFRSARTIRSAMELCERFAGDSVVSVSEAREHPFWCKRIALDGTLQPWEPSVSVPSRRQDLPPAYCLNGVVYLASADTLHTRRSLYSQHTRALVVPEGESLDLDLPSDWEIAECLWHLRHETGKGLATMEVIR
jgi:CMP-N-acetylneuraminic acid synthetase